MKEELIQEYQKYLESDTLKFAEIKKQIQGLVFWRLFAFVGIITSLIFKNTIGPWFAYSMVGVFIGLFFFWVKRFIGKEKEKIFYSNLIRINQKELLALTEEYSQFDAGGEFVNPSHPFSFDMDLFGDGSVFQFLNRTSTQLGKKTLADFLQNLGTSASVLRKRQQALLELAGYTRWRQFFAAKGNTHDEDDLRLLDVISGQLNFSNYKMAGYLIRIMPVLSLLFLFVCIFTKLPWVFFVGTVFLNGIVLYYYSSSIKSSYLLYGSQSKLLGRYVELFNFIEQKTFQSDYLIELKKQLYRHDEPASLALRKLRRNMAEFDYRQNLLVGFLLNALFIWDVRCISKLYRWQLEHKESIHHWFAVIGKLDALSCLANMNHNHPDWAIPIFEEDEFHYACNDLAHPLIRAEKRIGNSFRINGAGQIRIITGANMAGKSTYLRALGVNLVLALNGCRVCASWFTVMPIALFTNMRTTDNLQKEESYFFAELQRLQQMLTRIRKGEKVFILIDEMLKGTNSADKLSGSRALVRQLLRLNAVGVVATHDLELTKLADDFPKQIRNLCFEVKLEKENLIFDYKLMEGVTNTMNASYLMRKMGIIQE